MNLFLRRGRVAAISATALFLAACGGGGYGGGSPVAPGGGSPPPSTCGTNTICMNFVGSYGGSGQGSFSPASLTVAKGTTVTFTNSSGVTHNVVFDSNAPAGGDIGSISSGSQTRTFSTVGTSSFHCTIHSGMTGEVVVQ